MWPSFRIRGEKGKERSKTEEELNAREGAEERKRGGRIFKSIERKDSGGESVTIAVHRRGSAPPRLERFETARSMETWYGRKGEGNCLWVSETCVAPMFVRPKVCH